MFSLLWTTIRERSRLDCRCVIVTQPAPEECAIERGGHPRNLWEDRKVPVYVSPFIAELYALNRKCIISGADQSTKSGRTTSFSD